MQLPVRCQTPSKMQQQASEEKRTRKAESIAVLKRLETMFFSCKEKAATHTAKRHTDIRSSHGRSNSMAGI